MPQRATGVVASIVRWCDTCPPAGLRVLAWHGRRWANLRTPTVLMLVDEARVQCLLGPTLFRC